MKRHTTTCLIIDLGSLPSHTLEQVLNSTDCDIKVVVAARHDELLTALETFPNLVFYAASRQHARGRILTKILQHYSPDSVLVRVSDNQWHKPMRTRQGIDVFTIATQNPSILQSQIDFLLYYTDLKQNFRHAKHLLGLAELRSQWLMDHSQEALAYIANGQHLHTNPAYLALMGLNSLEDAHATQLSNLVPHDQQALVLPLAQQAAIITRPSHRLVTTLRPLHGQQFRAEVRFTPSVYRGQRCVQLHITPVHIAHLAPEDQPNTHNPWRVQNIASDLTTKSTQEAKSTLRLQLHQTLNLHTHQLPTLFIADNLSTDKKGQTINQRALLPHLSHAKKRIQLDHWNLQQVLQHLPSLLEKYPSRPPQILLGLGEWLWLSQKARSQLLTQLQHQEWVKHIIFVVSYHDLITHWSKVQLAAPEIKASNLNIAIDEVMLDSPRLMEFLPLFNCVMVRLEREIGEQIAHSEAIPPALNQLLTKLRQLNIAVIVDGITDIASMNRLSGTDASYLHGSILERLSQ